MKKYSVVAVTLLVYCGMALTAHAQDEKVVVTVPFEFIAGGQTLPAGTYTIARTFPETSSTLLISGGGTHGLFVLPAAFDGPGGKKVQLSFVNVGETHLLSAVTTEAGTYTIATGPAAASLSRLAKMKSPSMKSDTSAAGTQ